jgi:hypothetical protein
MTNAELRGQLLAHFFTLRYSNGGFVPVTEEILGGGEPVSREAIAGACRELADVGLIEWTPYLPGHVIGTARIRCSGVDAVERGESAALEIRLPNARRPDLPAATSAIKEPERINLADGLKLLEEHLPSEEAKARLRQAFVQKAFPQAPLFALSYDEAVIDWTTGLVKIPRRNDRFCPTFLRADFASNFLRERMIDGEISKGRKGMSQDLAPARPVLSGSVAQPPQKPAELVTLKPAFMGMSIDLKELWRRFWSWWAT